MSLTNSSDLPKKGDFYQVTQEFYAINQSESFVKVLKNSHVLVTRGGKNIQFSAKADKKSPIHCSVSSRTFLQNCIISAPINDESDITQSYSTYKIKNFENGGFSYKLLENNIIIGEVICQEYRGSGVPNIQLTPVATCSCLSLKQKIKSNRDKRHSLKTFLYFLYLGYSGFISFDDFCRKI